MTLVPLKVRHGREAVSNAGLRLTFVETARERSMPVEQLALVVARAIGWHEQGHRGPNPADADDQVRGVFVLLGIAAAGNRQKRETMKAWRAYQIAYVLQTLDEAIATTRAAA